MDSLEVLEVHIVSSLAPKLIMQSLEVWIDLSLSLGFYLSIQLIDRNRNRFYVDLSFLILRCTSLIWLCQLFIAAKILVLHEILEFVSSLWILSWLQRILVYFTPFLSLPELQGMLSFLLVLELRVLDTGCHLEIQIRLSWSSHYYCHNYLMQIL